MCNFTNELLTSRMDADYLTPSSFLSSTVKSFFTKQNFNNQYSKVDGIGRSAPISKVHYYNCTIQLLFMLDTLLTIIYYIGKIVDSPTKSYDHLQKYKTIYFY